LNGLDRNPKLHLTFQGR